MKLLIASLSLCLVGCAVSTPVRQTDPPAGLTAPPSATQAALAQDKRFHSLVDSINPPCSVVVMIDGKPVQVRDGSVVTVRGKDGRFVPMTVRNP